MGKYFRALRAEQYKLWHKKSNCMYFVGAALLTFLVSLYIWAVGSDTSVSRLSIMTNSYASAALSTEKIDGDNWSIELSKELDGWNGRIKELADEMNEAKGTNSYYTLTTELRTLQRKVAEATYMLDHNIPPADSKRYDSAVFAMWLMTPAAGLFVLAAVSDLFAGEFERGTISSILPRPVTRIKQYAAKLTAAYVYAVLMMLVVFISSLLACSLFISSTGGQYVGYLGGRVYTASLFEHCLHVFLCDCGVLLVMTALCAAAGNLTRSRIASVAAPFAVLCVSFFFGESLGALGKPVIGATIFSSLDMGAALCSAANYSGLNFSACVLASAVHFLVFTAAGYIFFKKDAA